MRRSFRVSFTLTILTAFTVLFVAAFGLVVIGYRRTGAEAARITAERSLAQAAETAAASTRALMRPAVALSTVLPEFAPLSLRADPAGRDTAALVALLGAESAVQVVSIGFADGTLRQVVRAGALAPGMAPAPPEAAAFGLREVTPGMPFENWSFLDAALRPLPPAMLDAVPFQPRQTQWYLQARDAAVHVSTLYDLALVGRPGLSISRRVPDADAVFALDITLDRLAVFLQRLRASAGSVLFLFTEDGILLAHQRAEVAAIPLAGGRTGWTTLMSASDATLRAVWEEFAQGRLRPGQVSPLAASGDHSLVRLAEVEDLAAPRVLVAVVAPLADFTAPVDAAIRRGTLLAVLALVLALLAIGLLAWRIARPLAALTSEAEAIRRLELAGPVPVRSHITEVARLAVAMDGMKSALRVFGAYVPRSLVGRLMEEGDAAKLGGTKRAITVMFSDVESFTTLAEDIPPEDLMGITSAYFEELTRELLAASATIDKYIGDAVMAIWNAPQDDPDHAAHGCRAALRARLLTERLCADFKARGWPPMRTRFGLHTGEAVVGNVGSSDRMAYTAIGSMVNLASRIEGMNKAYGTQILVSEATRLAAGAAFVTRPVDLVLAKGSERPVEVHELLGVAAVDSLAEAPLRVPPALAARLPAWRRMVGAYRAGRFAEAAAALAEADDPAKDPLVALYAERLAALREAVPPDWSPVLRFTTK
jgi:adenylate cyclase